MISTDNTFNAEPRSLAQAIETVMQVASDLRRARGESLPIDAAKQATQIHA